MKITNLILKNFQSYEDQTISFDSLNCCLIEGRTDGNERDSNGTGKSTIFDAIVWCLYGKVKVVRSGTVDDVVRIGSEACEVVLEFEHSFNRYRVERTRNKTTVKSTVKFLMYNGEEWSIDHTDAVKIHDVNRAITSTIGINYDMFVNSIYFKPGEISAFADMSPGERIDAVKDILNIGFYDKCMQLSRSKAKEFVLQVTVLKGRSETLESIDRSMEVFNATIVKKSRGINNLQKLIATKEERLSVIRADVNIDQSSSLYVKELSDRIVAMGRQLSSLLKDRDRLATRIDTMSNKVRGLVGKHSNMKEEYIAIQDVLKDTGKDVLQGRLTGIKESLSSIQSDLVITESVRLSLEARDKEIDGKKDKLRNLDTDCPMCLRPIDESTKQSVIQSLDLQVEEIHVELDEVTQQMLTYREREAADRSEMSRVSRELDTLISAATKSQSLKKTLIEFKGNVEELNSEMEVTTITWKETEEKVAVLQGELVSKKEELESYSKLIEGEKDLSAINSELDRMKGTLSEDTMTVGSLKERVKGLRKDRVRAVKDTEEIAGLEESIADLKIIGEMFGKTGIQSMIVANTCVEVQSLVNDYLSQISDNRMSISIEVDAGKFDIIVNHSGMMKRLEQLSEGEKVRVSFSIRMAFSMLLHRRANDQGVEFLLIDEAIQNLDESGIEKFAEELVGLHNLLGVKIFLITHRTDIRNYFDERLIVDKVGGISTVTVM